MPDPSSKPYIDHMVLLVPHSLLTNLPAWITTNFIVLIGGRHASGATENKLIVFRDGTYLEVIAFLSDNPTTTSSSSWARRKPGQFIDWACSLGSQPGEGKDAFPGIQQRVKAANTGLFYSDLRFGGRTRPDGTELRWCVSDLRMDETAVKPNCEMVGGEAPFWCFDETPRSLRVPVDDKRHTAHPCGALGVAELTVLVRDEALFSDLGRLYSAVYGPPIAEGGGRTSWLLTPPLPSSASNEYRPTTVSLSYEPTALKDAARDVGDGAAHTNVHIQISLWAEEHSGRVGGLVGGDSEVVFELVRAEGPGS